MTLPASSRPKLRLITGSAPTDESVSQTADGVSPVGSPVRGPVSHRNPLVSFNDSELVALGLRDNRDALEVLYRRHAPFAINLATRVAGSTKDVDDVVHDAFIKAFRSLASLRDPSAFRVWLGAIVIHQVRSSLRRSKLLQRLGIAPGSGEVDLEVLAAPDLSPLVRVQIAQTYALLRTQSVDERIAWVLRCVEGHDLRTVAELTGCSLATVKRRIDKVQRFLEAHFVDAEVPESRSCAPDKSKPDVDIENSSPVSVRRRRSSQLASPKLDVSGRPTAVLRQAVGDATSDATIRDASMGDSTISRSAAHEAQ